MVRVSSVVRENKIYHTYIDHKYQSSYFGIKQSRSEAKQSEAKPSRSQAKAKQNIDLSKKFFTQFSLGLTGKGLSFRISGALKG